MWILGIYVLISLLPDFHQCGCDHRCHWVAWEPWNSCSEACGGGYKYRYRQLCCRVENGKVIDYDLCLQECKKSNSDSREYTFCNTSCHNGGSFHFDHHDINSYTYNYGHCICSQKYGGACCDKSLCGWDGKWCWPGTCGSSNYEKYCYCDSGFSKETNGTTTKCQLQSYTQPTLLTCRLGLEAANGEIINTTAEKCADAQSVYTNLQPARLTFRLDSSFGISVSSGLDPGKNRIIEWKFGVVENMVKMIKKNKSGFIYQLKAMTLNGSPQCSHPFSDRNPRDFVSCTGVMTNITSLNNGESICIDFKAYAGGYLKSKDLYSDIYKRTENQRELCIMFDNSAPVHCIQNSSCKASLLQTSKQITDTPNLSVNFSSWTDPVPAGGRSHHASGIKRYTVEVLRVSPSDKNTLEMRYPSLFSVVKQPNESVTSLTLLKEPALYAVVLEVHDKAGNVRMARRFVYYDNSSTVALFGENYLRSTSATSQTNYTWQTHHGETCFSWTERYYNTFLVNTNLLRPIKPASGISPDYDQFDGPLPTSGRANINGIIRFDYKWKLNNRSYHPYKTVPDVYNQSFCEDLRPSDGQRYTFKIKPIDINSRFLTEEYIIYVDRSPPDIDHLQLLKDGYRQLFILSSSNLSTMILEFEALDKHSGLRTIQWTLGANEGGTEFGSGIISVNRVDGPCSKQECYCPSVGSCENYVYRISLNNIFTTHPDKCQHNKNFFLTVVVTNNARLINIKRLDILLGDFPPEEGMSKERNARRSDTDCTRDAALLHIQSTSTTSSYSATIIVILGAGLGCVIIVCIILFILLVWKRSKGKTPTDIKLQDMLQLKRETESPYEELQRPADNNSGISVTETRFQSATDAPSNVYENLSLK